MLVVLSHFGPKKQRFDVIWESPPSEAASVSDQICFKHLKMFFMIFKCIHTLLKSDRSGRSASTWADGRCTKRVDNTSLSSVFLMQNILKRVLRFYRAKCCPTIKRCWHHVARSQEFGCDYEKCWFDRWFHQPLSYVYLILSVSFFFFFTLLYDALSWVFLHGCRCILKKAILGSAHHLDVKSIIWFFFVCLL